MQECLFAVIYHNVMNHNGLLFSVQFLSNIYGLHGVVDEFEGMDMLSYLSKKIEVGNCFYDMMLTHYFPILK